MAFIDLAKTRFSCRKYSNKPVEPEKIAAVLNAAAAAPTGCNLQPQRILVMDDPAVLAKVRSCTPFQFGAPVTFLVCYDQTACWHNDNGDGVGELDASIVVTHMLLQAAELGLGTCMVAYYDKDALIKALDIPKNYKPVLLIPMGYPAEDARPAAMHGQRKAPAAFCARNHF